MMWIRIRQAVLGLTVVLALTSAPRASANFAQLGSETLYALTAGNTIFRLESAAPNVILESRYIWGVPETEALLGLDYRPATGQLYAFDTAGQMYLVHFGLGLATPVGGGPFSTLAGLVFGMDFNPVVDRLRVMSEVGENWRLNPNTGALAATDTPPAYAVGDANEGANPHLVALAYANNFPGAATTTLYGIDSDLDVLVTVGGVDGNPSPNGGQLFTVGSLGVDTNNFVGFDISPIGVAHVTMLELVEFYVRLYTLDLTTGSATLVGIVGDGTVGIRSVTATPASVSVNPTAVGLTTSNKLVLFDPAAPSVLLDLFTSTGIISGETVLGLDFRPATGQLYALGSTNQVYTVSLTTGAATPIGPAFSPALSGVEFGIDINPVADRVRVVSDADENFRLNPDTGATTATDTPLAYAAGDPNEGANPNLVGSAYTNSFAGSALTTLYGIDSALDALILQGSVNGSPISPNAGQLYTVGALGVDATDEVGFDVTSSGTAYASLTAPGGADSQLYNVDLPSGAATLIGTVAGGEVIRGMAVMPAPPTQQLWLPLIQR